MFYIFDLGNVIVDIDFNWVLGVWSDLICILLVMLKQYFIMGEVFYQYECGEFSDEDFVVVMCYEMNMFFSYEQFVYGWQVVFVVLCLEVIIIMYKFCVQGYWVVVFFNINCLYIMFWFDEYLEVCVVVDCIYLLQEMGLCKFEV